MTCDDLGKNPFPLNFLPTHDRLDVRYDCASPNHDPLTESLHAFVHLQKEEVKKIRSLGVDYQAVNRYFDR